MRFFIDSIWEESDNAGVVSYHLILWLVFTILRIPLMRNMSKHYESGTNKKITEYDNMSTLELIWQSAYQSLLVQSAWGALDMIPISFIAKLLSFIQISLSFFITGGIITMLMTHQKST